MNALNRIIPFQLLAIALVLAVLPGILGFLGLTTTSATEVVVYAIACMALNIIVGHTGLVSFGHGAWFGLAAYIAALLVGLVKGVMIAIGFSSGSTAAIYLLMLIVLLVRPRGLLGERIARFE